MYRRHVDPPFVTDDPLVFDSDVPSTTSPTETVVDLREPKQPSESRLPETQPSEPQPSETRPARPVRSEPRAELAELIDRREPFISRAKPKLSIAVDVSHTLEGTATGGSQRVAVALTRALDQCDDVTVTLLDARSGRLRPLTANQRQRFATYFEHRPGPGRTRFERRLARAGIGSRRWEPESGTWFIDLEASWLAPTARAELLPTLEAAGVQTAAFIPDLLPLKHPNWYDAATVTAFRQWLRAHRTAASTWLAASQDTADELVDWLGPRNKNRDVKLLRLGANQQDHANRRRRDGGEGRVMMLGAVTNRSGHRLLLDALGRPGDHRSKVDVEVDVVGAVACDDERLIEELNDHPQIRWHNQLSDMALERLWRETSYLITPSRGDGLGLAVVEALARSIPVLTSDLPVLVEMSQGRATTVAATAQAWRAALANRGDHYDTAVERALLFKSSTWADTATDLARFLTDFQHPRRQRMMAALASGHSVRGG